MSFTKYKTVKAMDGFNNEESTKNSLRYRYFLDYNASIVRMFDYYLHLILCSFTSCATTTITVIAMLAGLLLCVKRRVLEAVWTVDLSPAMVGQLCFGLIIIYFLVMTRSSDSNLSSFLPGNFPMVLVLTLVISVVLAVVGLWCCYRHKLSPLKPTAPPPATKCVKEHLTHNGI